jgi:hypothetical protein
MKDNVHEGDLYEADVATAEARLITSSTLAARGGVMAQPATLFECTPDRGRGNQLSGRGTGPTIPRPAVPNSTLINRILGRQGPSNRGPGPF